MVGRRLDTSLKILCLSKRVDSPFTSISVPFNHLSLLMFVKWVYGIRDSENDLRWLEGLATRVCRSDFLPVTNIRFPPPCTS